MIKYEVVKRIRVLCFLMVVFSLLWLVFRLFVDGVFGNDKLISESISLLIALISLVIAYASMMITMQNRRPVIELSLDFNSRYNLVQLNIENIGEKGARDIKLNYSNDSIWNLDITDKSLNQIASEISILSSSQAIKKTLGLQSEVNINSSTDVLVTYKDLSGLILYSEKILINLNDYKNSASYESELSKTLYELQQLPKEIRALKGNK